MNTARSMIRGARIGAAALALALLAGCASFQAKQPEAFSVYPRGWIFKGPYRAVSPDGVLFTARLQENDPEAGLGFWKEALKTRMGQAGYRVVSDSAFALKGTEGSLLKLAAPVGNQDYLYWVALGLSPSKEKILVIEAAGESKRFLARQEAIRQAIAESGF